METESIKQLTETLPDIMAYIKPGVDFVVSQAPDIAQEILFWGRIQGALWAIFMVVFWASATWCLRCFSRVEDDQITIIFISCLTTFFMAVVSLLLIMGGILPGLQAYFTPKLYLLEYVGQFTK